jgi:predicted ArsR family transcriptional regulator
MNHGRNAVAPSTEVVESKLLDTLKLLRDGLADADSEAQVVDAESASTLLGMSARTARRVLQELAREGLAWPVPASAVSPGRPRQTYRLVGTRS